MTDVKKQVGMAIRRLRRQRGISQQTLAQRVRVYRSYLSGVESGRRNPTIRTLGRLAEALEVPLLDLFRITRQSRATPARLTRPRSPARSA